MTIAPRQIRYGGAMLDQAEIPLITPGQRARVSEAWIDNVHRGRAEPVAAVAGSGRKGGH